MSLTLPESQNVNFGLSNTDAAGVVNLLNSLLPGIEGVAAEAWMAGALQAMIGYTPTRVYLDQTPLLLDTDPIFI